jgi:ribosomal protein S18 acetylase RimI-like enzyme
MKHDVFVRPMTESDAPEVALVIKSVIEPLDYYNDRARGEELSKYRADELARMCADDPDAVLVALSEQHIAGFLISHYDDGLLWLSWFGVAEHCRQRGVGAALLAAFEETAPRRRAHKVWCDTRVPNEASARLLERAGFVRICELKNHWYGQDFFIWEKPLTI